jgi:hypothetical protein
VNGTTGCQRWDCSQWRQTSLLLGLFQGWSWAALEPWDASVEFSYGFWVLRVVAGLAMFGGLLAFLTNIWLTFTSVA